MASAESVGGCRCGQVRFEVTSAPMLTMACHCRGCQRMSASAYSLSAAYPAGSFEVTAGEPVIGGMHGATRHYFCPQCMSWMFTRPEGMDELVNVRLTMLDKPGGAAPFIEFYRDEGLPWAATGATHSFGSEPDPNEFPALLAQFANMTKEAR